MAGHDLLRPIIFISLLLQLSCRQPEKLTLQVKVSELRRQSNSFAVNKRPDEMIEIKIPGQIRRPPTVIHLVRRSEAEWSTPEGAIASILSANSAGDLAWILENYVPAEREQTRQWLADPAVAKRNQRYYADMEKVEIIGWAEVRGFRLVFLHGRDEDRDSTFEMPALAKTASGWKQTNALSKDDTFELVWTAFHTGGVH